MARTRLNPRLTKIFIDYTLFETAKLYGLHDNMVRSWIATVAYTGAGVG